VFSPVFLPHHDRLAGILHGPLRSIVKRAVYRFLECGILEYGFARVVCKNCKSEFVVGLSCKTRLLCPSCQAKRLTLWSEWLGERLLAKVPHSESVAENMLTWPHSGFHVHLGPLIHEDEGELITTTARYCARAPLSLSRLTYDRETQRVTYAYTNSYDNSEAIETLTPLELIARLVLHIPNPREPITRYYCWYAHRTRGVQRKRGLSSAQTRASSPPCHWKKSWAELLQLVFEVSLACPRCGSDMKIVSFITGAEPIGKILRHLREKGIDARAGPFADSAA
jgi:hypothetical protein